MATTSCRRSRTQLSAALIAAVCLIAMNGTAVAQQQPPAGAAKPKPKPGAAPEDPAAAAAKARAAAEAKLAEDVRKFKVEMSKIRLKFSASARAGEVAAGEQAFVDEYYGMWTDLFLMPGAHKELPDLRDRIKKETRVWGNAPEKKKGLDYVNNILLDKMNELANNDKAPALVRYNAMLVIGDLNDVETNISSTNPITPAAAAAPELLKALADPDPQAIDAIKVAALVGLVRHTELGIADKKVEKQIQDELLKLVAEENTPEGRSTEGHLWLRRRGIEILARIIKPGAADNQKFAAELKKTLSDKSKPMIARCEAAVALGKIGANDPELVPALAGVLVDIMHQETTRRGMKTYLHFCNVSLNGQDPIPGFAKSLPAAQKKHVDDLNAMLKDIFTLLEKIGDDTIIPQRMPEEGDKLQDWLAKTFNVQPAAQPATP